MLRRFFHSSVSQLNRIEAFDSLGWKENRTCAVAIFSREKKKKKRAGSLVAPHGIFLAGKFRGESETDAMAIAWTRWRRRLHVHQKSGGCGATRRGPRKQKTRASRNGPYTSHRSIHPRRAPVFRRMRIFTPRAQ
jgi:hypothetical protein